MPALVLALVGCGGGQGAQNEPKSPSAATLLPNVRRAKDRPPVVLVSREGDPSGAVAVAVSTAGVGDVNGDDDDPEPPTALAAVVEARLAARGLRAAVTPQWDGFRAVVLVDGVKNAELTAGAIRAALVPPADEKDVAAARKKLSALAARPVRDPALLRWSRCVGSPRARLGAPKSELGLARLEAWRSAAHGLGRVAISVAGPAPLGEAVATAVARGEAWKTAGTQAPAVTTTGASEGVSAPSIDADVYDASADTTLAQAVVHATFDVPTSSAAVATAGSLGDPHGPLATRLAALDVPFRLREITGAAHPRGGCVGVVLEAAPSGASGPVTGNDLAARVADAVALVRLEAEVHLAEGGAQVDGRTLATRAGDAREAAERAAWWALVDGSAPGPTGGATTIRRGSIALGLPGRRGSPQQGAAVEPSRDALAAAAARASASWKKPVVEGRTRVEAGQGEAWVLVASPCGTESETEADAGVTALFVAAAAESAKTSPEVHVEPWVVADGAGLLVHGPALAGETPAAHARRLADVVAQAFAAVPLTPAALTRARAEMLYHDANADGAALGVLASALAPSHPSWVVAWGREDSLTASSDSAVINRAQALRAGPLRVAILANVDGAQGDAALRAADRWIDRHEGATRACRPAAAAAPARAGTYAATPRPGSPPEALLAFPFPHGDESARASAMTMAAALDGAGGLLETSVLGASGLARSASARVLGGPRAPALVVRIVGTQATLDAAVMQTRALVDRLRKAGLSAADVERANAKVASEAVSSALDPRARVVATWREKPVPPATDPKSPSATADDVKAFALKYLGEESMIVVAARPPRPPQPSPSP
ncbi:exonuclease SbcC [Labilithrix luteola]|uniref:Exonuclease SbcC n=1 Tax=Labilithrix luteola TaxID=1391654 RepID=A0A0K1QB68_9BACT|nr:exonuclease SbcC [Labilithrix luteola]